MNDRAVDAFDRALERLLAGAQVDEVTRVESPDGADLAAMLAASAALRDSRPELGAAVRTRQRGDLIAAARARAEAKPVPAPWSVRRLVGPAAAVVLIVILVSPFAALWLYSGWPPVPRHSQVPTAIAPVLPPPTLVVRAGPPVIAGRPTQVTAHPAAVPSPVATRRSRPAAATATAPPPPVPSPTLVPPSTPFVLATAESPREAPPNDEPTEEPAASATPPEATATPGVTPVVTPVVVCGTGVIAGTVRDVLGRRVIGAQVTAARIGGEVELRRTASLGDGGYRFVDLCPGLYTVSARISGPVTLAGFYDADGDGQADSIDLAAAAGDRQGADIVLVDLVTPNR